MVIGMNPHYVVGDDLVVTGGHDRGICLVTPSTHEIEMTITTCTRPGVVLAGMCLAVFIHQVDTQPVDVTLPRTLVSGIGYISSDPAAVDCPATRCLRRAGAGQWEPVRPGRAACGAGGRAGHFRSAQHRGCLR